jgi:hypothetical protein
MAIEETKLPGGRWERTYTGKDVSAVKGELNEHGAKAFHEGINASAKRGFERINDPNGTPTYVHADEVEKYRARGYGKTVSPSFVVPELPWDRKQVAPGKHRYKIVNGEIAEVE